jgi:predicted transcriptional regulator
MAYLQIEDFTHTLLSPGDLISLANEDARIPGGAFAMRALNKDNVERLVLSDADTWPDIQVTLCIAGYIVIDGYHRWEAAKIKHLKGFYATCKTYRTENDVVEAAFRANLHHGLQASQESRGDYAYWLHLTYPELEQIEIARRVGISQSAVSQAISKREEEAKKAAGLEEALSEKERQRLIKKTCKKFTREAVRFLDGVEDLSDQELIGVLKTIVKKDEERERLARIGRLLSNQVPSTQFARLLKKDA